MPRHVTVDSRKSSPLTLTAVLSQILRGSTGWLLEDAMGDWDPWTGRVDRTPKTPKKDKPVGEIKTPTTRKEAKALLLDRPSYLTPDKRLAGEKIMKFMDQIKGQGAWPRWETKHVKEELRKLEEEHVRKESENRFEVSADTAVSIKEEQGDSARRLTVLANTAGATVNKQQKASDESLKKDMSSRKKREVNDEEEQGPARQRRRIDV
ncbi:hypothetical protein QBC46DRAFT_341850 [Diplogelasinospora grovesii]|uniref:Uncharacterized protein n=1 Tax=Diplogelasinospora grovesii TaxID=303347 RepID=A0AAN6N813_9PEZI|nr:hypothetical protein QBC46DRAFT_341850 [Diplogelasinospora grovesii]